jgi:hypothetical protein
MQAEFHLNPIDQRLRSILGLTAAGVVAFQ